MSGTTTSTAPSGNLLIEARFSAGPSFLARVGEFDERFGHLEYRPEVGLVYPDEEPIAFYAAVGPSFSHADKTSLGSQRFRIGVEAGVRAFLPWWIFKHLPLEVGGRGSFGYGELNFGGGDIPMPGLDAQVGISGRLLVDLHHVEIGASTLFNFSPVRGYTEFGVQGVIAVPLERSSDEQVVIGECPGLVELEARVDRHEREAREALHDVQLTEARLAEVLTQNDALQRLQLLHKAEWIAKKFTCRNDLPATAEVLLRQAPAFSTRLFFPACEPLVAELQRHDGALTQFEAALAMHRQAVEEDVSRVAEVQKRLISWKPDCSAPAEIERRYLVKTDKGVYGLVQEILFANADPDLRLGDQRRADASTGFKEIPVGFTEPDLDEWIRFLRENRQYKIRLDGYASAKADNRLDWGEAEIKDLATKRVGRVYRYLTTRGLEGAQMVDAECKSFDISGPFVPAKLISGPVPAERILGNEGHGEEGLKAFARKIYGEKGSHAELSNPIFRSVRITLLEEKDGRWREVPLKTLGEAHG